MLERTCGPNPTPLDNSSPNSGPFRVLGPSGVLFFPTPQERKRSRWFPSYPPRKKETRRNQGRKRDITTASIPIANSPSAAGRLQPSPLRHCHARALPLSRDLVSLLSGHISVLFKMDSGSTQSAGSAAPSVPQNPAMTSCRKKKSEEATFLEDVKDHIDEFIHASMDEHKTCFKKTIQKMFGMSKVVAERSAAEAKEAEVESALPLQTSVSQ
ncbi:hypothetical protein EJB05_04785, partial [Eragrostis curvula]